MDEPLIATSARKHGIHDDDMLHAFNHPISVDDLDEGFVMFVGADIAGTLLEIPVGLIFDPGFRIADSIAGWT